MAPASIEAKAVITCEGSEREITITGFQGKDDPNIKIDVKFNPALDREEEANEYEGAMHFLFNCFIRGIEREA